MNHRLLTPAENAANKKRRERKKTLKRKLKRHAALDATIETDPFSAVYLACMDDGAALVLQTGTAAQKRELIDKLAARRDVEFLMPHEHSALVVSQLENLVSCPPATHEFVLVGNRHRLKRRQPFTLW